MEQKKVESPDVQKEDVYQMGEDYSIKQHGEIDVDTRRAFIAGYTKASKELAELRAQLHNAEDSEGRQENILLKAERDKLKEARNEIDKLWKKCEADNERLKELCLDQNKLLQEYANAEKEASNIMNELKSKLDSQEPKCDKKQVFRDKVDSAFKEQHRKD